MHSNSESDITQRKELEQSRVIFKLHIGFRRHAANLVIFEASSQESSGAHSSVLGKLFGHHIGTEGEPNDLAGRHNLGRIKRHVSFLHLIHPC